MWPHCTVVEPSVTRAAAWTMQPSFERHSRLRPCPLATCPTVYAQVREERERRRVEGFTALLEEAVELGAQLEVMEGGERGGPQGVPAAEARALAGRGGDAHEATSIRPAAGCRAGQGDRHTT